MSVRFPFRSLASKLSFELGRNPKIEKIKNWQDYIPESYKSVLVITSDLELAWAYRFAKLDKDPVNYALEVGRLSRLHIPRILELCDKFEIPITWATVGHLFIDSCQKIDGIAHPEIKRLNHFENDYWKFDKGDWFKDDPCTNIHADPQWYGTDIIDSILKTKVKHEIGCHTFSHIDCTDRVCPPEVFLSDLEACKKVAKGKNIELKSFVYPAHTFGNTNLLKQAGFDSYRTNYDNTLGYPYKQTDGVWVHKSSGEFNLRRNWSIEYHIYRYKKMIDRAIKNHNYCHLWFHPSMPVEMVNTILPQLFEHIYKNRKDICTMTMGDYTDWLNKKHKLNE
jgi:peptidoglycan/xylan/chitin deacetylase (PgdA/CDA1 family)